MKFKNYKKLTDEFATKILYPVKCVNKNCPFYKDNLKKADQGVPNSKSDYKLHCIYREFNVDFFKMPLEELPKNASSLRFRKYDANIMGLCLTLHVNLGLSLRKTSPLQNSQVRRPGNYPGNRYGNNKKFSCCRVY